MLDSKCLLNLKCEHPKKVCVFSSVFEVTLLFKLFAFYMNLQECLIQNFNFNAKFLESVVVAMTPNYIKNVRRKYVTAYGTLQIINDFKSCINYHL